MDDYCIFVMNARDMDQCFFNADKHEELNSYINETYIRIRNINIVEKFFRIYYFNTK